MASLFRNSRSIITRLSCIQRTAVTTRTASTAGVQVKTSVTPASLAQTPRSAHGTNMAVRDARQSLTPADAIKPRPAGPPPLM